jgi:phage-related protein
MERKEIHWLGDSIEVLSNFSKTVRQKIGWNLDMVQMGVLPLDAKPMTTIGRGVWELRASHRGQFRLVYVVKKGDAIYVLHVFEKKTQKTSAKDIRLARQRLKGI